MIRKYDDTVIWKYDDRLEDRRQKVEGRRQRAEVTSAPVTRNVGTVLTVQCGPRVAAGFNLR